jgi:GNAT superfamily N-acetyltransferase
MNKTRACARWLSASCEHYQNRAVDLAQVLLDPGDTRAVAMFKRCRFEPLGRADLPRPRRPKGRRAPLPSGFAWDGYSSATHAEFARAVARPTKAASTCPRLNGRRKHRRRDRRSQGGGRVRSEVVVSCYAIETAAAAVESPLPLASRGVVLLNRSTRTDSLELVYLGLAPVYRGKQLGDAMMRHAMHDASTIGARRLSLAVDSNNAPALRLYQRHGMTRLCSSRRAAARPARGGAGKSRSGETRSRLPTPG